MKFNDLRRALPAILDSGLSLELISAPGRGKSEFIEGSVDDMSKRDNKEWGFATLFLATQTPPDLIGFQFKGQVTYDGKEYSVTDPTMPTWFITDSGKPVFAYERGVVLLDEFGQGQTDVKAAAAELFLNKRIGKWRLPDGWSVIAASNRQSDRSGVTKSLDFIINRRCEIQISDDLESWTDWAASNGVTPLTIAFANQNPNVVFTEGVPEKQGPWCTPRSLVMADKYLRKVADGGPFPNDPAVKEIVSGIIGSGAMAQLFAFIQLEREMPKYETIVREPTKCKVPEKPDAQMLVCFNLAHRVKAEDTSSVITYIERMPKEFAVIFAKQACFRDHNLVMTPAFNKWAQENSSLMAVVTSR